jgi:hypothetical protein
MNKYAFAIVMLLLSIGKAASLDWATVIPLKIRITKDGKEKAVDVIDFVTDHRNYVGADIRLEGCDLVSLGQKGVACTLLPLGFHTPLNLDIPHNSRQILMQATLLARSDLKRAIRRCDTGYVVPECRVSISGKVDVTRQGEIILVDPLIDWPNAQ